MYGERERLNTRLSVDDIIHVYVQCNKSHVEFSIINEAIRDENP
jgi:hypothetical protein